jgi:hypothetical protein
MRENCIFPIAALKEEKRAWGRIILPMKIYR